MAGTRRTLRRGEYRLTVPPGAGPAGVRRSAGPDVWLDVRGGCVDFSVDAAEDVFYWWRGETRRGGVELARRRPALARPRVDRALEKPAPVAAESRVGTTGGGHVA